MAGSQRHGGGIEISEELLDPGSLFVLGEFLEKHVERLPRLFGAVSKGVNLTLQKTGISQHRTGGKPIAEFGQLIQCFLGLAAAGESVRQPVVADVRQPLQVLRVTDNYLNEVFGCREKTTPLEVLLTKRKDFLDLLGPEVSQVEYSVVI